MSLWQKTKDFLEWDGKPTSTKTSILDRKVTTKTAVTLGTMRAGKTTYLSGLGATAQYKASGTAKSESKFRFLPREGNTNLLDDIAELRAGHFPPATAVVTGNTVKPNFKFEWEEPTFFGTKWFTTIRQVDMPVIDYAGEQLVLLSSKVKAAKTIEQMMALGDSVDQLTSTVNNCSALFIILSAERAEGLPIFKPDPYDKIKGLSKHPDVNMQRLLSPILEFKHDNRDYSPPLEQIFLVVTCCDLLFPIAKAIQDRTNRPFNPLDPAISSASLDSFLKAFFPGTHSLIVSLGVNIQYYPSYFQTDGFWDTEKTEPRIKCGNIFDTPNWENNVNRPQYTEFWFNRAIEGLKEFAIRV